MTKLEILSQFKTLFEDVQECLLNYNQNLKNELFEVEPNETNEKAYKRGESIYDRCEYDLKNIREIIEKKEQIDTFFRICQENEKKLIEQKNLMITKLVRIKKNTCKSKEEWLNCREEWNKKREERDDEKNRRECEEMLEEIKEEKKIVQEMTMNIMKVKEEVEEIIKTGKVDEITKEMNTKIDSIINSEMKEFKNKFEEMKTEQNSMMKDYVKTTEYNSLKERMNELTTKDDINEIISNYVKKDEILDAIENEKQNKLYNLTTKEKKQIEEWDMGCTEHTSSWSTEIDDPLYLRRLSKGNSRGS